MEDCTTILISLDTLRSDCLKSNKVKLYNKDYPTIQPPNTFILDKLAAQGTFFQNCITAAPYTSASHAAYFTGKWPLHNGVFEVYNGTLKSQTIFNIAKANNWKTIFKTDFPLILGPELGFTNGVDEYIIEDDKAFLAAINQPGSKVAFAHFGGIHYPYGFHNLHFGGKTYIDLVDQLEKQYAVDEDDFLDKIDETYRNEIDRLLLLRYKRIIQFLYKRKEYKKLFSLYLEGLEYFLKNRFSYFINDLFETLRNKPYLIIIFGDHGEQWDDQTYGHHNSMNEGVLRVPVIMIGQGIPVNKIVTERIRTIDILPTILDKLKVPLPDDLDGNSLWPFLSGEIYHLSNEVAFVQAHNCEPDAFTKIQSQLLKKESKVDSLKHVLTKESVYQGSYKYIRQLRSYNNGIFGILPDKKEELYYIDNNLELTKIENKNLCKELSGLLNSYNDRYKMYIHDNQELDAPEDLKQFLQNLGYNI